MQRISFVDPDFLWARFNCIRRFNDLSSCRQLSGDSRYVIYHDRLGFLILPLQLRLFILQCSNSKSASRMCSSIWSDTNTEHKFLLAVCGLGKNSFDLFRASFAYVSLRACDVFCCRQCEMQLLRWWNALKSVITEILKFFPSSAVIMRGEPFSHVDISYHNFLRKIFELKLSTNILEALILSNACNLCRFRVSFVVPCATENEMTRITLRKLSEAESEPICIWIGKRVDVDFTFYDFLNISPSMLVFVMEI